MKPQIKTFTVHGTRVAALTLCTALALSAAHVFADDQEGAQGGPGSGAKAKTGKGGTSQLSQTDEKFVQMAAHNGLMEIRMGNMAARKAQHPAVKQFGQTLVQDHTKANAELRQVAANKGMKLPIVEEKIAGAGQDAADSERQQVREKEDATAGQGHKEHAEGMKKLQNLSGTEFDREFVQLAVTSHQKTIHEFEKASQQLEDTQIKSWAQKTLPTLREHLQKAQGLQTQLGGGAQGAAGAETGAEAGAGTQPGTGTQHGTGNQPGERRNEQELQSDVTQERPGDRPLFLRTKETAALVAPPFTSKMVLAQMPFWSMKRSRSATRLL
jgi:putative membrane protein